MVEPRTPIQEPPSVDSTEKSPTHRAMPQLKNEALAIRFEYLRLQARHINPSSDITRLADLADRFFVQALIRRCGAPSFLCALMEVRKKNGTFYDVLCSLVPCPKDREYFLLSLRGENGTDEGSTLTTEQQRYRNFCTSLDTHFSTIRGSIDRILGRRRSVAKHNEYRELPVAHFQFSHVTFDDPEGLTGSLETVAGEIEALRAKVLAAFESALIPLKARTKIFLHSIRATEEFIVRQATNDRKAEEARLTDIITHSRESLREATVPELQQCIKRTIALAEKRLTTLQRALPGREELRTLNLILDQLPAELLNGKEEGEEQKD